MAFKCQFPSTNFQKVAFLFQILMFLDGKKRHLKCQKWQLSFMKWTHCPQLISVMNWSFFRLTCFDQNFALKDFPQIWTTILRKCFTSHEILYLLCVHLKAIHSRHNSVHGSIECALSTCLCMIMHFWKIWLASSSTHSLKSNNFFLIDEAANFFSELFVTARVMKEGLCFFI